MSAPGARNDSGQKSPRVRNDAAVSWSRLFRRSLQTLRTPVTGLQPAAHGGLVLAVLSPEFSLQVLLLFRDDDVVDERHRADECGQQPQAVDPARDTELEQ